jgi:hypothetical protein
MHLLGVPSLLASETQMTEISDIEKGPPGFSTQ